MNDAPLTIGQLARQFGLNASAIRYYERVGVLPEPERESGQRRYGPDALRRLRVLEVAKRAGFSLDETKVLLQGADTGSAVSASLRELAARKLPDIEAHIARAQAMRDWMLAAADCACPSFEVCALFGGDSATASARGGQREPSAVGARPERPHHRPEARVCSDDADGGPATTSSPTR